MAYGAITSAIEVGMWLMLTLQLNAEVLSHQRLMNQRGATMKSGTSLG